MRQMRRVSIVLAFCFLPAKIFAESMSCGGVIVQEGASVERVVHICGEPVSKRNVTGCRQGCRSQPYFGGHAGHHHRNGDHAHFFHYCKEVCVSGEEWAYDPGPLGFFYLVRFRGGVIYSIRRG